MQPDDPERNLFAWGMLSILLVLLAMAAPFYAGLIYAADDLLAYHLPAREFYARCLAQGHAFDWWPNLYSGFYLTGEGQAGTYHPLHYLLYRWLPLHTAFCLEVLLNYPLLIAGTYFFIRGYVSRDAALLGGLCFGFSGFALLHFVHVNAIGVIAHLPWLLLLVRKLADSNRQSGRLALLIAIAVLTGSQLLLGYPQYVWFSLLAEIAYSAALLADGQNRNSITRLVAWLIAAKELGFMLGAVQLLPTIDSLLNSSRQSAGAEFANSGSLYPLNLLQFVAPYATATRVFGQNTHELGLYLGAVPLVLIVWGVGARRSDDKTTRLFWSCLCMGALALAYAFGEYGPLYALQTKLPVIDKFRFPCRAIVLAHFALSIAAAVAFSWLVRPHSDTSATLANRAKFLLGVVIASIVAASIMTSVWGDIAADMWLVWSGPILVAVAAGLVFVADRTGKANAIVALIVLMAVDLGVYGLSYSVYPGAVRRDQVLVTSTVPESVSGRVAADLASAAQPAPRIGNAMLLAGVRRTDGYAGLEPARMLDYQTVNALRLSSTVLVARSTSTEEISALEPLDERWLSVPRPLPRVRLVTQARYTAAPAKDLKQIDPQSVALVNEQLDIPPGEPGVASIIEERPGLIHIRVRCATRQFLVVAESFHAGWKAFMEGDELPIYRAYGDFMGCTVEPGEHDVLLVFRPDSLVYGKYISLCGLVLLCGCAAGAWVSRYAKPRTK